MDASNFININNDATTVKAESTHGLGRDASQSLDVNSTARNGFSDRFKDVLSRQRQNSENSQQNTDGKSLPVEQQNNSEKEIDFDKYSSTDKKSDESSIDESQNKLSQSESTNSDNVKSINEIARNFNPFKIDNPDSLETDNKEITSNFNPFKIEDPDSLETDNKEIASSFNPFKIDNPDSLETDNKEIASNFNPFKIDNPDSLQTDNKAIENNANPLLISTEPVSLDSQWQQKLQAIANQVKNESSDAIDSLKNFVQQLNEDKAQLQTDSAQTDAVLADEAWQQKLQAIANKVENESTDAVDALKQFVQQLNEDKAQLNSDQAQTEAVLADEAWQQKLQAIANKVENESSDAVDSLKQFVQKLNENQDQLKSDLSQNDAVVIDEAWQQKLQLIGNKVEKEAKVAVDSLKDFVQQLTSKTEINKELNSANDLLSNLDLSKKTLSSAVASQLSNSYVSDAIQTKGEIINSVNYSNFLASQTDNQTPGNSANNQSQNLLMEMQKNLIEQEKSVLDESNKNNSFTKVLTETNKTASIETTQQGLKSPVDLTIKSQVGTKSWHSDFNSNISLVAKNGGGKAIIRLNPANLGPIEANIKIVNEVATVQIVATHAVTRESLENAIPRLRDMLESQGFSQVDVNISEHGLAKENRQSSSENQTASKNGVVGEQGDLSDSENKSESDESETIGVVDYYA